MQRSLRLGVLAMALAIFASGCYGPFNLTRRLYRWNGQINGKWEKEFMFIVLAWLPVYGLAVAGDAIVFNSMEFWTGNNPVDPPMAQATTPKVKRIVRGEAETLLTYTPAAAGDELLIQQFKQGQPLASLHLERREGVSVGSDADGRVLFTAHSLPGGGVIVSDATGQQVASYSEDEVERFLRLRQQ